MLNSCSPSVSEQSDFDPIHFYSDCVLRKTAVQGDNTEQFQCSGADAVCNKLRSFVQHEQVLFNPSLDASGCQSLNHPLGMTLVRVVGLLHRGEQVVGNFLQQFVMLKDPAMSFNWRVKSTDLIVKAGAALAPESMHGPLSVLLPLEHDST